jgi:hypothetical protein
MPRKRFSTAEKAIITAAGPDGRIEWQNLTQWHPGRIVSTEIRTDFGWQYVEGYNLAKTPRLSTGPIRITPGHIRTTDGN